jgi:uncharacterized membrane protein
MTYLYNNFLDLIPVYERFMRFKGEESKVDCLAYIDNLIIKAILASLGSSTYKNACLFLDRVKDNS